MSLTGPVLPWVLIAIAVVTFVLLVLGIPHSQRRWLRRLTRAVLAVVLNVAVLCSVGVKLNNQYQFYTSWSDLLGAATKQTLTHHGGQPYEAFDARVKGQGLAAVKPVAVPKRLPNPGSRVQTYELTGAKSGVQSEVVVHLPLNYDPSGKTKYPVVIALHGFPGSPESYDHLNDFFGKVDQAVTEHKMAPAIFVVPNINTPHELDTECVNSPNGPKTETWLAQDIPQWVASNFPVSRNRDAWASYGFSFGGWCAAMLAIKHPDVFGAAVAIQGYFRPEFDPSFVPFSANSPQGKYYDLVEATRKSPAPIALWTLASKQDSISYPTTREFLKVARAPMSVTAVIMATGGHRGSVWVPRIPDTFVWLGKTVPGFKPKVA